MTTPLAIFHKKNTNQQPSAAAQCAGKQQKSQWKFPVSKAFYEKIRIRGERIMDELGYGAGWSDRESNFRNGQFQGANMQMQR